MFNYTNINPSECEFIEVASEEELPSGERIYLEVDSQLVVIFNNAGEYFAIADLCSHDDGPLGDGDLDGLEISCPRHGARFNIRTGKALTLPAIVDIPAYPVRVKDGIIEVGFPTSP